MRVLLLDDATTGAAAAARFLSAIGPALRARVTVVTTTAARERADGQVATADLLRAARLRTEELLVGGRTAASIASAVGGRLDEGDVDLVVVGSPDRRLRAVLTRSTGRLVLRRSPVSVMVVGRAPDAVRRILVCTTLRLPHGAAIAPVVTLAAGTGADVHVLHVMSQLAAHGETVEAARRDRDAAWHREHRTAEGRQLERLLAVFADHGVVAAAHVRHGLVVDEIVAAARRRRADLVVVGAHSGAGRVARLLENVAERVVEELDRPVLVVRDPQPRA